MSKPLDGERVDDEGLPIDRKPTMDDVRGNDGGGRTIALGCTALVLLVLLAFFVVRVVLLR